jgi:hypothetical protein
MMCAARFGLAMLAATVMSMTAYADPDAGDQRAREHYERGKQLAADRLFAAAYGEFSAGFDASSRPLFLFNMAECQRALGNDAHARDLYERFVAASPDDPLAATAKARLAALPAPASIAVAARQPSAPASAPSSASGPATTSELVASPSPTSRAALWFGIGALAASGGALAFELAGESVYSNSKAANDPSRQRSLWHSANDLRYAAEGVGVIGVACAATSVWLYLRRGYRDREARAHHVHVVPTSNGVALLGTY